MIRRISRRPIKLERSINTTRKFEDTSSDHLISSDDLFSILASLEVFRNMNYLIKRECDILEKIALKSGKTVSLDLPVSANNFNGTLSDLLCDIFGYIEEIKKEAERVIKYHTLIRDKYDF